MAAFLVSFESTYKNGAESYLIDGLGFTQSDVSMMRKNLTVDQLETPVQI